jgi:hypothetical protein
MFGTQLRELSHKLRFEHSAFGGGEQRGANNPNAEQHKLSSIVYN